MTNTREKLIELLETVVSREEVACCGEVPVSTSRVADHLIAHGVTVQDSKVVEIDQFKQWIPVTERLPEDDSDVLAYLRIGEEGRIYPANYAKGMWFDCLFNTPATDTTTHWMPLPEPPKGE